MVKSKAPTIPPRLKSARLLLMDLGHPRPDDIFLATKVFVHGSVGKASSSQMEVYCCLTVATPSTMLRHFVTPSTNPVERSYILKVACAFTCSLFRVCERSNKMQDEMHWQADRAKLRDLQQQHPDWSRPTLAQTLHRSLRLS